MVNRIETAYNEIVKWKQRFDKLFSSEVSESRAFKLEHLKMYDQLLQRSTKGLSRDERSFRNLVKQERRNLVRSLYPNPLIRLLKTTFDTAASVIRFGARLAKGKAESGQTEHIDRQLKKTGFGDLSSQVHQKIKEGQISFQLEQSVSLNEKERLNYLLSISTNERGIANLNDFQLKQIKANGEVLNFKFDSSTGIDQRQAAELANGRAIKFGTDSWKLIDFNDKDASGNYLLKDIRIPGFDVGKELDKLPLKSLSETEKQELVAGFQQGKRMNVDLEIAGKSQQVQIEAQPLKRGFQLYEGGKKISLDKLLGKEASPAKHQKLQIKAEQKPHKKIRIHR